MNLNLKALLGDLPEVIQYIVVLAIVMIILYVCLTLTRLLGQGRGKKVKYDNPEEYEKTVPDLFASTFMKRKVKKGEAETEEEEQD